jgi:hypothetical protein
MAGSAGPAWDTRPVPARDPHRLPAGLPVPETMAPPTAWWDGRCRRGSSRRPAATRSISPGRPPTCSSSKVFDPVFPPDAHAGEVVAWLRDHSRPDPA